MNDRHRFDELWNDFLEGELSPERMKELQELLHDPQWIAQATDQYQLHRLLGMNGQSLDEEENDFVAATMDLLPADQDQFVSEVGDVVSKLEARSESSGKSRQALFPRLRVGLPVHRRSARGCYPVRRRVGWSPGCGLAVASLREPCNPHWHSLCFVWAPGSLHRTAGSH